MHFSVSRNLDLEFCECIMVCLIPYSQKVVKDFQFEHYKAYLQYLYTNEIDVTPTDAVGTLCHMGQGTCATNKINMHAHSYYTDKNNFAFMYWIGCYFQTRNLLKLFSN